MNSSGIKRGLAVSAVSALAVAGIPALATSASATPGETLAVVSVGPTANGGDVGGLVRLKTNSPSTDFDGTTGDLALANTSLNAGPNNSNQAVSIVGTPTYIADGATGDSDKTDGLHEVLVNVKATTSDTGATATYALFIDEDTPGAPVDGDVDAGEARAQVSQTTSGAAASVTVSPSSQSVARAETSGAYTVTVKDTQGRTTQLATAAETVAVSADDAVNITPSDASLTGKELELGAADVTFDAAAAAALGNHVLTFNPSPAGLQDATATLTVVSAAAVAASNVDIVTGADDWDGLGDGASAGTTLVRVDQSSIRIDIKGSTAGGTVTLHLGGGDVKFGGKDTATVSTVLDADGNGSLTITPDAGTVQVLDQIAVTGSFDQTIEFQRAAADSVAPDAGTYYSALKATTSIKVTVVDQFGDAIGGGFVSAQRQGGGANPDADPQVKPVNADGTVTFDFTDAKAVVGGQDVVGFGWVPDQFETTPQAVGSATIKYTASGMGKDFNTTLEGQNTGAVGYQASDVTLVPLADAKVLDANEAGSIVVTGGEANQTVTLSADNGALILKNGQTTLAQGAASVTATTDVNGDILIAEGYQIIGTQAGLTTLTISSANRTETAQFVVAAQTNKTMARNITVSGPAEVDSDATQATFTAVVTDNFGNPVIGYPIGELNFQVSGPAQFQDGDATTNELGQINLNVRLDSDAEGDVTIKVTGLGNQFGAAANQSTVGSAANSAPGLTASSNIATATTTVTPAAPERVDAELAVTGKGGKRDRVKADAIRDAAGAKAILLRNGKKIRTGVLNQYGNLTFKVRDRNGNQKTRYVVKIRATDLTFADRDAKRIR